jgi:urea transporter
MKIQTRSILLLIFGALVFVGLLINSFWAILIGVAGCIWGVVADQPFSENNLSNIKGVKEDSSSDN